MFWVCLIFVILLLVVSYLVYDETRHRILYGLRTNLEEQYEAIRKLKDSDVTEGDEELKKFLEGELAELSKTMVLIDKEYEDNEVLDDAKGFGKKIKEGVKSFLN